MNAMNTADEQKYLSYRSKIQQEMDEIQKQLDELNARWNHLSEVLNGNVEVVKVTQKGTNRSTKVTRPRTRDKVNNPDPQATDNALVQFLAANPGAKRKDIDAALTAKGHTRYAVDKSLKRCRSNGVITNEGSTQQTKWSVVV